MFLVSLLIAPLHQHLAGVSDLHLTVAHPVGSDCGLLI